VSNIYIIKIYENSIFNLSLKQRYQLKPNCSKVF